MSWVDKMKEYGGANVHFLSEDGEAIVFIVVGEPVLLKSKYKGQETERIGCPIVTDEGFTLLIAGKRLARRISKHEAAFDRSAFVAVRHGAEGDTKTTYELSVLADEPRTQALFAIKKAEFKPALIKEALQDADEIMKG